MNARCFYFGCYREAGHYLWSPGWGSGRDRDAVRFQANGAEVHIDGSLAPRQTRGGLVCWGASCAGLRAHYCGERQQGLFLRHELPNGFTAVQWWDRQQGDTRPGSNSTILLEGVHDTAAMLVALDGHFPTVRANLERGGFTLAEVSRG